VEDEVDRAGHVHEVGDVAPHQPEPRGVHEVGHVGRAAGAEVVEGHHLGPCTDERLAQVAAEEPSSAGHDDALAVPGVSFGHRCSPTSGTGDVTAPYPGTWRSFAQLGYPLAPIAPEK
jgi:hypothetical protein